MLGLVLFVLIKIKWLHAVVLTVAGPTPPIVPVAYSTHYLPGRDLRDLTPARLPRSSACSVLPDIRHVIIRVLPNYFSCEIGPKRSSQGRKIRHDTRFSFKKFFYTDSESSLANNRPHSARRWKEKKKKIQERN